MICRPFPRLQETFLLPAWYYTATISPRMWNLAGCNRVRARGHLTQTSHADIRAIGGYRFVAILQF